MASQRPDPGTFLALLADGDLDALLELGSTRRFARGERVMRQGEPGDRVLVLLAGHVKASSNDSHGREMVLITGNTILEPSTDANPKVGILYLVGGTGIANAFAACADIKSNIISQSGSTGTEDVHISQSAASTIRLPGYLGPNNDNTAVANFINAANPSGTTTLATNTVSSGGGGFTGDGSTCP